MIALGTALYAAAWLSAVSGVTVTVAPDQPLPHIYIDEPLILELIADESIIVSGEIRVYNDEGFVQTLPLASRRLPAGAARWVAVEGMPVERGNYRLEVHLQDNEERSWQREVDGCFIARPPSTTFARLVVDAAESDTTRLELAARAAGLGTVRLDATAAHFDERLQAFLDAGLRVVIAAAPPQATDLTTRLSQLERAQRDLVIRCELAYEGDSAAWTAAAILLQQGVSGLEVTPVVANAEELGALAGSMEQGLLRHAVLTKPEAPDPSGRYGAYGGVAWDRLKLLRTEAERHGIEHLVVFADPGGPAPMDSQGIASWIQGFLLGWSDGYNQLTVSEGHLLHDEGLGRAYPYLAMMAHRLQDYRFMGMLPMGDEEHALLFRRGAAWLIAAWSDGETTVELPLGEVSALDAFDARGNALEPGTPEDGVLTVALDPMPRFWTGRDGTLFDRVARERAVTGARAVLAHPRSQLLHPDIFLNLIREFLDAPDEPVSRRYFFTLLQSFPELESHWHSGREPVEDIVPLVARLAEFTRALCVLEEMHGEQFLEPLSDTLAQCSEYQALYLTGSTGQGIAHDRGDWLLRDIDRLTAEARLLSEHGRLIEANAVANLAEWRARSLGAITQSIAEAR